MEAWLWYIAVDRWHRAQCSKCSLWLISTQQPLSLFYTFFRFHYLCLALIMSFTCSMVSSLGSLVAAPQSPRFVVKFLAAIKFPGSHIVNLPSLLLLASSVVNGVPWSSEGPRRNSHTFNCRMLVNPHSENQDESHEHEPQPQKYETMQCFAVSEPKSIKEEGDGMQGERGDSLGKQSGGIIWPYKTTLDKISFGTC